MAMNVSTMALAVSLLVMSADAQAQHSRAVAIRADAVSLPSAPAVGWPVSVFTAKGDGLMWRVRLSTKGARPWTDAAWLSAHTRLADGAFVVPVWRFHPTSSGWAACQMNSMTIPAQPDQTADFVLDMSKYGGQDWIEFEQWPGYDVELIVTDGAGVVVGDTGFHQTAPWSHPPRAQVLAALDFCN
jgi:hypothetical protein